MKWKGQDQETEHGKDREDKRGSKHMKGRKPETEINGDGLYVQ